MIKKQFYRLLDLQNSGLDRGTLREAVSQGDIGVFVELSGHQALWRGEGEEPDTGSSAHAKWRKIEMKRMSEYTGKDEPASYLLTGRFAVKQGSAFDLAHDGSEPIEVAFPNGSENDRFVASAYLGDQSSFDDLLVTADQFDKLCEKETLTTSARTTLLIMIEALCREQGIDTSKHTKAGDQIAKMSESFARISTRAAQDWLKLIPDAIERKSQDKD